MKFTDFLADILFPRSCVSCKMPLQDGIICNSCLAVIPINQTLFCATCDARLPYGKKTCHPNAPCLIGGATHFSDSTVKELVHRLKFKGIRNAALPLAELIKKYLSESLATCPLSPVTLIIPIPLSRRRHNERGYNQAEEIAKLLSSILKLPLESNLLARTRHTKPQTEMNGIEGRLENLRGCFTASPAVARKNILLIDDVTTSGATFREAATALKAAGARTIIAVAAAKA